MLYNKLMIMNSLQLSKHLHIFYNNREREDTPKKQKKNTKEDRNLGIWLSA